MAPFARDQAYDGPPFRWDEEDRLRRRARLDAVFFHLYGLDREAADYILGTFPIIRREEEQRYAGPLPLARANPRLHGRPRRRRAERSGRGLTPVLGIPICACAKFA